MFQYSFFLYLKVCQNEEMHTNTCTQKIPKTPTKKTKLKIEKKRKVKKEKKKAKTKKEKNQQTNKSKNKNTKKIKHLANKEGIMITLELLSEHRITEYFDFEGTHKDHWVQPLSEWPIHGLNQQPWKYWHQTPTNWVRGI